MDFVIVSGLSGAGKSQAKKVLEDMDFYCVDNLPPSLIPQFVDLAQSNTENLNKVGLVCDIRGGKFFMDLNTSLEYLESLDIDYKILFFEASTEVLIKRFKETRRSHPLNPDGRIEDCIEEERQMLEDLRDRADLIVDTSGLTLGQLKQSINVAFEERLQQRELLVQVMSFGFKRGIPRDADMVFDARFLPNPYYLESLRFKSGNDQEVRDYVMQFPDALTYFEHITKTVTFITPLCKKEGRSQLVVAIGCTGGQHRSVTFANNLYEYLKVRDYNVKVTHRDVKVHE